MKKPITFKNDKGQTLKGVLHIPDDKYLLRRPGIVIYHGYTGNKDTEKYQKLAENFAQAGFVALRFDFTCSGESEGKFEDITVTQEIADAKHAITALASSGIVDVKRIGVTGHSLGGAISIFAAQQDSRIKTVIASCAPVDAEPVFRQIMGTKGFREWEKTGYAIPWKDEKFKTKYTFWQDYQKYDLLRSAKKIKASLLVFYAERDEAVAPRQGKALAHAANAPLKIIPGAGHDYDEDSLKLVAQYSIDWFNKQLM